ncbi:MAG: glutaredoxin [Bdellovibrionaceae bacterium]|nr:glutaredoxin [Pseudobdellovibrionaceae bacterium]
MRKILSTEKLHSNAKSAINEFHSDAVTEVEQAITHNEWVVVGMKQNPVVSKARSILKAKGINYKYIEHGSYFGGWKKRLAIKLWSGWPTFPQVFHNGILLGGAQDLEKYLKA